MVLACTSARPDQGPIDQVEARAADGIRRTVRSLLSLTLLCLLACARAPSFDLAGEPAGGAPEVLRRINHNALLINSLRADIRLRSDRLPHSGLARADLLFARPRRYRVQLKTIFGNTMAVFTVRRKGADLYLPMANRLYQGDLSAARIRDLVGIELPAADLLETLTGIFHLPTGSEILGYRRMDDDHLLIFSWERGRREIRVAPDGYRILQDLYRDEGGRVVVVKEFEDYRMVDGVVLPGKVRALLPERQEELEVRFTRQVVNEPWEEKDFHLDLPGGVERIPWELEYR